MAEWIWFNGEVMPLADARVGVEDRGFQFADGVYEVIRLYGGVPFTLREHLERLTRSAEGIGLRVPQTIDALSAEIRKLADKSAVGEGMVYLQLTRGAAPRNHVPPADLKPTLLFYVRSLPPLPAIGQGEGARLHSVRDERWERCWVKSIALLPNILAKQAAVAAGADEAVFVKDETVSECSASNLFAIINGVLTTHPVGPKVLPGVTRTILLRLARESGISVAERPIGLNEAMTADELFITSTTRELSWVSHCDGRPMKPGRCGPTTVRLHQAFREHVGRDLNAAGR